MSKTALLLLLAHKFGQVASLRCTLRPPDARLLASSAQKLCGRDRSLILYHNSHWSCRSFSSGSLD